MEDLAAGRELVSGGDELPLDECSDADEGSGATQSAASIAAAASVSAAADERARRAHSRTHGKEEAKRKEQRQLHIDIFGRDDSDLSDDA